VCARALCDFLRSFMALSRCLGSFLDVFGKKKKNRFLDKKI